MILLCTVVFLPVYVFNCVSVCIIFWGAGGGMFTACCMCMCTPQHNISIHSCPVNNMCAFVCVCAQAYTRMSALSLTTIRPGLWSSTGDQTCAPKDTCTKPLCDTHSTFTEASAGFFLGIHLVCVVVVWMAAWAPMIQPRPAMKLFTDPHYWLQRPKQFKFFIKQVYIKFNN